MGEYQVLDVTCGGRMSWQEKAHPNTVYMDIRIRAPGFMEARPNFEVDPDIQGDFTAIPFEGESFNLVYMDPPHILRKDVSENSWLAMRYGKLFIETWKATVLDGLTECWRVLKMGGSLIFKWSEAQKPIGEVLDIFPHTPMFGSRMNKSAVWLCFYKLKG